MKRLFLSLLFIILLVGCTETIEEQGKKNDDSIETSLLTLTIDDSTSIVSWNDVGEEYSYTLYISDVTENNPANNQESYVTTETMYSLSELLENRMYSLFVTIDNGVDAPQQSNIVIYDTFVNSNITLEYSFNENSNDDLVYLVSTFTNIYRVKLDSEFIDDEYFFDYSNRIFILKNEFIDIEVSSKTYEVYTEQGIIDFVVSIEDITLPYMRSEGTVTYQEEEDLLFILELCGGEFIEINGSDLEETDYILEDNTLIILYPFVQNLFDENAERDTIILSYQLKLDDEFVIGYIFILRDSE